MNTLKDLQSLISSLNATECGQITGYIKDKELGTLFTCIKYEDAQKLEKLTTEYDEKSLDKLISTLYYAILDNSIIGDNALKSQIYTEVGMAKLTIRKNLLYAQNLVYKSHLKKAIEVYKKNVVLAQKHEFYEIVLSILYDLDNLYSALSEYSDFKKNYEEIEHYEQIRKYSREAYHLFNKNGIERTIFVNNKSLVQELESSLPKLNDFYLKSNSAQVKWYYYRTLIDYLEAKNNYSEALKMSIELLEFQLGKPSIKTPPVLAITYKLITRFNLAQYNFEDALSSISKAKSIDKFSKHNHGLSVITEFYILFYMGKYSQAETALKNNHEAYNEFNTARNKYYRACIAFFQHQRTSSIDYKTIETKEIEKDKEGWNIYIRLLQILQQLESKKNDVADAYIESLRKHIERNKSREVYPRLLLILKMLRVLVKDNFNYKNVWQKHEEQFELLSSETDENYSWKILSPELIRFDVWFEAKARKLTYQEIFNERVKVMRENNALT